VTIADDQQISVLVQQRCDIAHAQVDPADDADDGWLPPRGVAQEAGFLR
jgi:hypothetical protein